MQLSQTHLLIIGAVLVILAFIWFTTRSVKKFVEGFQAAGDEVDGMDLDSPVLALPPEQCSKMMGIRSLLLEQIEDARVKGNTGARNSYEYALRSLEDTMNISRCDMEKTAPTTKDALQLSFEDVTLPTYANPPPSA
jgi:hypothetical protein